MLSVASVPHFSLVEAHVAVSHLGPRGEVSHGHTQDLVRRGKLFSMRVQRWGLVVVFLVLESMRSSLPHATVHGPEPSPLPEFRFDKNGIWRRIAGKGGHVLRVEHSPTSRLDTQLHTVAHACIRA